MDLYLNLNINYFKFGSMHGLNVGGALIHDSLIKHLSHLMVVVVICVYICIVRVCYLLGDKTLGSAL